MPPSRSLTARERARAELTSEIKAQARIQLAEHGAGGLSLRAIARELGMVSSAIYRYFPSRDDLLTALIIDACTDLGDAVEQAGKAHRKPRLRWRACCTAAREWALEHRQEYALIYGSPVPGYAAPQDTVAPAARVPLVLLDALRGAHHDGQLTPAFAGPALSLTLKAQVEAVAEATGTDLPADAVTRAILAWTQLFGMISFELFGQLVGSVDPSKPFFDHCVESMADFVGLPA
ncbi:TetR/AcrR family transcriptional regulator [Labedaea rhizosphaerae]|uniref:TetR family transcriptional regulator n=1 Tax=Labedaea rhizosphaerae TaxID=598644 RepID=A0A4R6S4W4_LABRH|nr:TetR/AcrR family transcriptional regulator [Labedaea rhizosphaerae]TDP94809.1 TetR family transcriptional regulator [Labedaea rhizosphaerae]